MDNAVYKYKKRRQNRLDSRFGVEVDSVEEFRKRRDKRIADRGVHMDVEEPSDWITVRGNHIPIDENGNAIGGQKKAIGGGGSKAGGATKPVTAKERAGFIKSFGTGKPIKEATSELKRGDIISDGKQAFIVKGVGMRRITLGGLTGEDKMFDGNNIETGGNMFSDRHFGDYRVVGWRDEPIEEIKWRTFKGEDMNSSEASPKKSGRGSSYVKSYASSEGVGYPEIKQGAVYDEDVLKEVNRLADDSENQSPKTERQGEVLRKLSGKDVVYQKDPDGTEVAAVPGLSQMWDKVVVGKSPEVQKMYDKRVEGGKKIGEDMVAISNSLGSRMLGLENMFKGGESTARKINKVKEKSMEQDGVEITDEQALDRMDDVVRFSYKCDHDKMVEQCLKLEDELKKRGYEIVERDNKFLPDPKNGPRNYKAVHLQVKAPNGELFEVQMQSDETIKIKNKNHRHFEKWRKINLEEHPEMKAEKDRLNEIMIKNTAKMREPPGILDLPTIKKPKKTANNA